ICVTDNGHGMSREDALLCFERHATSKIADKGDLRGIQTLGFRGEALSSIMSISQMEMKTAPIEGGEGTFIEAKGGKILKVEPTSRDAGTTFEIYSLFYNVPARLEFQKSIRSATMEVTKMVQRLALSKPQVRFSYVVDKKVEFDCPATDSLTERAEAIFGLEWVEKMIPIDFEEGGTRCYGMIAKPEFHQKTRSQQFFFINGRTASANIIQSAVYEAYQKHLPPRTHPAMILFIEIPFDLVDVNVHPQKSIVRLKEEQNWFRLVQKAVDRAFISQMVGVSTENFSSSISAEPFAFKIDAFDFPMERAPRSYLEKQEYVEQNRPLTFRQTPLIDVVGIMILEGFLLARYQEKTVLADLDRLEDALAMRQIQRFDASIQTECIHRTIRLDSLFDLEEKVFLEKLRQYGIQGRFLSKMAISIEGLAPCMDPERLEEIISTIFENPHRTEEAILSLILPKMRKGYLKKDCLLATNGFREYLESGEEGKGRVFVPLENENLKRCFAWKG
ncbi:MAG: DNA mismatch repair endonuclease MutL, partial [Chlamydiia bacterium]